jgi:myo-inositol-1(or 4)-monophosphatase
MQVTVCRRMPIPEADWLGLCRRAAHAARAAVAGLTSTEERSVTHGEGEGGDTTLAVDKAAEDAIFAELEAIGVPLMAVSEERGEVSIGGGPPSAWVVVDPVDGSVNAKRRLPFACVSIAVASGERMGDVEVGFVAELVPARDWWAVRGEGAFCDGPDRWSCSAWRRPAPSGWRRPRRRSGRWARAGCGRSGRWRPRCAWWRAAGSTGW